MKKLLTSLLCAAALTSALTLCACHSQNGTPQVTEPDGTVDLARIEETVISQTADRTETLIRSFDSNGRLTWEETRCVFKAEDHNGTLESTVHYYESGRVRCESICERRTYPPEDGKTVSRTEEDETSVSYADTEGHEITRKYINIHGQRCRMEYYTTVTDGSGNAKTYLSMLKNDYSFSRAGETCWVTEYDENGNEISSYGIGVK